MTILIIIGAIGLLAQGIFMFILPPVHLNALPFIGSGFYDLLVTMVSMWNAFIVTFPYAGIAWNVFLYVILPFELIMIIGKAFLGSRMPHHTN